jgi:hypothetical protein
VSIDLCGAGGEEELVLGIGFGLVVELVVE